MIRSGIADPHDSIFPVTIVQSRCGQSTQVAASVLSYDDYTAMLPDCLVCHEKCLIHGGNPTCTILLLFKSVFSFTVSGYRLDNSVLRI